MKNIFTSTLLSLLFLASCTTRIVNAEKPYADDKISVGKTYTFFTNDGKKEPLNITKIDSENIYGKNSEGKEVVVEKSKITEIKKSKTGATIGLVVGVIALAVVGDAFYHNKPIGQ